MKKPKIRHKITFEHVSYKKYKYEADGADFFVQYRPLAGWEVSVISIKGDSRIPLGYFEEKHEAQNFVRIILMARCDYGERVRSCKAFKLFSFKETFYQITVAE
jgi:hypothetical protein